MAKLKVDFKKVNKALLVSAICFYMLFIVYLLATRNPNYFTSEKTKGIVVDVYKQQHITATGFYIKSLPVIHFKTATDSVEFVYSDDEYLTSYSRGDIVSVVYKGNDTGNSAILSFIGYWVTLNESMASLFLVVLVVALVKIFYSPKPIEKEPLL